MLPEKKMKKATTEPTAAGHNLLHAPLTVPHDRLKVTHVDSLSTWRGETFVAQVQLDGKPFGTFENQFAGMTAFSPAASGDDAPGLFRERNEIWAEFAKACVYSDERVADWHDTGDGRAPWLHEEDVAEMLVQEYDVAAVVARMNAQRRVCVRVFSTTIGFCPEILGIDMLRLSYRAAMDEALCRAIRRQPDRHLVEGEVWQVWTGEKWHDLTSPVPAEPDEHDDMTDPLTAL